MLYRVDIQSGFMKGGMRDHGHGGYVLYEIYIRLDAHLTWITRRTGPIPARHQSNFPSW